MAGFNQKLTKNSDEFWKKHKDVLIDPKAIRKLTNIISTGSIAVDGLLNGGIRRGEITEIYGPPGAGKSTFAQKMAANILALKEPVIYFDLENGLDLGTMHTDPESSGKTWLEVNGIDVNDPNLHIMRPESGEEMYAIVEEAIIKNYASLIVLDSMAAVISTRELEADLGTSAYGAVANLNSSALRRVMASYAVGKNRNTAFLIVNQVRDNLRSPHGGKKSTGGNALPHYANSILKVWKIGSQETGDEVVTNTRVSIEKCRYAPRRAVDVKISNKRGIDMTSEILDFAVEAGYVQKAGAWFTFFDPTEEKDRKEIAKMQGIAAAKQWMDDNGWTVLLYPEAVRSVITVSAD